MKPDKYIILLLLFCFAYLHLWSQAKSYTLDSNHSGQTKAYVARDYIELNPGFTFEASAGNSFTGEIDPALLFPPHEGSYITPDGTLTESPLEGSAVGSIPGQFAVSPTGGATYTIPIDIPAGINGMQPNISLVYNSQSGNGIAGWGWNLSGMSAISRTGKTFYLHNAVSAVSLNDDDNLILDGQRLIKTSGSNLQNEAEYSTEAETFSKITGKIINNNLCFEVKTKQGLTMEYGSSADSYIEAQNPAIALTWLLKKVTDSNGNYMLYYYGEDNSACEFRLDSICYAGNTETNTSLACTLEFTYIARTDTSTAYIAGNKITQSKLLKTITVKTNSEILRTFEINYLFDGLYSKIETVTMTAGNGEKVNDTKILWGNTDNSSYTQKDISLGTAVKINYAISYYDFNADGRMDMIYLVPDAKSIDIYFANGNKDFTKHSSPPFTTEIRHVLVGDFNGDGYGDFACYFKNANSVLGVTYFYSIFLFNGTDFTRNILPYTYGNGLPNEEALVGDFDGDGKDEILLRSTSNMFGLNGLESIVKKHITWGTNYASYFSNSKYQTDFNGDGKTDVFVMDAGGYRIYTLTGINLATLLHSGSYPNNTTGVYFGDFNGDGKTDILTQKTETAIHLSTGTGFKTTILPWMQKYKAKLFIGDFNRDGKSDFACMGYPQAYNNDTIFYGTIGTGSPGVWLQFRTGLSTGNDFKVNTYQTSHPGMILDYVNCFYNADFTGDGHEDILLNLHAQGEGTTIPLHELDFSNENLLVKSITEGNGIHTDIDYSNLNDTYCYSKTENCESPVSTLNQGFKVVRRYRQGDGNNILNYNRMQYEDAMLHRQGKGFLCFRKINDWDSTRHIITENQYTFDDTFYHVYNNLNIKTTLFDSIYSTGCTTGITNLYNNRYLPYLQSQYTNNYHTGLQSTTTFSNFDSHGNPQTVATSKGDITETQTLTYTQAGSWCPNKPSSVHTVSSYQDMRDTVVKAFEYDSHGNLTKEILHPGKAPFRVETVYANYDLFGRARSVSVKAKDASGVEQTRTTSQTFTLSGRFAASKTDALGQTTTYSWDETRGLLTSETDPWGRATTYGYDSWGNLLETRYPDGNRHTAVLRWAGSGAPAGAKYYRYEQTSGNAPALTWFDGLAREIRRDTRGLNDREIYVSTEYYTSGANTGKIYRVSEPYFAGESATWAVTYNTFDSYGRNTKLTTPAGQTTTVYSGLTTTVTTPEGTKSTTVNTSGLTASSAVNGKTVGYTYYPNGLTKTATPDGGQPIAMEYNPHGKRTKLTDPDAGVIETRYNGFGETVEERQKIHNAANWNVTTNNYSPAGLLQSTVRGSETTAYTYDGDLGHPARIKSIEIAGQHRQSFTYDNLGRITGLREEIDNKTLNRSTEYDALGRIKRETYPTGYYSENHYDSNGILTKTTDSRNRRVWELTGENARGQITEEKKGNLTTTYGYDTYGLPASITAPGILNIVTGFDAKGNLVYRSNTAATPGYESFKYDGLNRLTEWKWNVAGGFTRNTVYSSGGNITRKDDLHPGYTLHYGANSKPHALTSITGVDYNDVWSRIPSLNMKAEYTDFNKIKRLVERDLDQYGNSYCSDDEECSVGEYIFTYGVDGQRRKMEAKHGPGYNTTYYFGNYEELCNSGGAVLKKIHYLRGAIYIDNTSGADEFYYTYTDYLGSLTALVNEQGQAVERYAYSPWGERINPSNLSMRDTRYLKLTRGYTMHEHLDWFGVINMNGRVYDPLTAMFFSPDPFVTYPNDWLNYNRYLYGLGNPFKYTDPSGENPLIIAMAVGLWINITMQSMQGNIDNAGDFWLAAGVGALSGLVGGAAGASVSSALGSTGAIAGFASGAVGGTAGGFVSGAGNAWLLGDASFEDGFMSGLKSAGIGALTGGIIGGISGGINAVKDGGNFWTGKGATFNSVLPSGDKNTVTVGEGMEYTTEYAKTFSDENFGQIKNLDNLYADGSIPKGYTNKGEYVYNIKGQKVGGTTVYNGIGKGSDVYLYKTAFTSRERLYLIMGHEYLHVHFNAAGYAGSKRAQDRAAYEWNMDQAKAWNMSTTHYESHYKALYSKFMYPVLDYRKAGFYILNIRPW